MKKLNKLIFKLSPFLLTISAHSWDGENKEQTQTNVPEDIQKEFHEQTKDYIAAIQEQAKDIKIEPAPAEFQERVNEALKDWEEALKDSNVSIERQHDCFRKNLGIFRSILRQSFETNSFLTSTAQQPLFLDNKEKFSVEIRPFLCDTNRHQFLQLGGILTARKQYTGGYVAGQFLYSYGEFDLSRSHAKRNDILLAFTYGKHFNDFFGGSLTFSSGYSWSDLNREYGHMSHSKAWSLGLSPLLVYYLDKAPVDFFLGGDFYYSQRLKFEEHYKSKTCTYDAENDLLWRIKAGPSYTMKREGKRRLYQLRFSLAGNVQSQIPDRFTVAPNVLFESQPNNGSGGYLFELGLNLGKFKKLWNIAYGLRF